MIIIPPPSGFIQTIPNLFCAGTETLRYLTPGKPTVFPILPPRENAIFPTPFRPILSTRRKSAFRRCFLCGY